MTPSPAELARIRHMSSIAKWTNESNRAFHHAMIDAGWIPVITDDLTQWGVYKTSSLWDYQDALDYYNEHGRIEPPTPF